jgi:hypothetical protein
VKVAGAAVLASVGATVGRLETLLMVVGTAGVAGATEEAHVVGLLTAGAEAAGELAGAHVAHVAGEETAGGDTGAAEDDGQGPQVADDACAVETATAVVWTFVVVLTTVVVCVVADQDDQTPQAVVLEAGYTGTGLEPLLLGPTGDDDQTAHVSDDNELLVVAEGFTGVELGLETTGDEDHTPHVMDEAEGVLLDETGETGVFELLGDVPQTPQEEVAGVGLLLAAGEDGV